MKTHKVTQKDLDEKKYKGKKVGDVVEISEDKNIEPEVPFDIARPDLKYTGK